MLLLKKHKICHSYRYYYQELWWYQKNHGQSNCGGQENCGIGQGDERSRYISQDIDKLRWSWVDHVTRMQNNCWTIRTTKWTPKVCDKQSKDRNLKIWTCLAARHRDPWTERTKAYIYIYIYIADRFQVHSNLRINQTLLQQVYRRMLSRNNQEVCPKWPSCV